jgi:hypothetical protein
VDHHALHPANGSAKHGRVTFHTGVRRLYVPGGAPRRRVMTLSKFALDAEREVPCDWTPDTDGV